MTATIDSDLFLLCDKLWRLDNNTVDENSSISSLIHMCWLPSASACGQ